MGPIGAQEMFFIVLLALLLFGPKKLPELGRMLGKGLTEFRRAKNELKSTFESHMQELDREARLSEQAEAAKRDQSSGTQYPPTPYSYPYDEYGTQASSSENGSSNDAGSTYGESQTAKEWEPVTGTVPRSKPGQTDEAVAANTEENHPA
jgi:sec-independent protein translocase protein TatA